MTQITIPAQVVNGHLQHEKSLADLEGQHVLATLTVVPNVPPLTDWKKLRDKFVSFEKLEDGWDSYRAPAPSPESIAQAFVFLEEAEKSQSMPTRLTPSVVGGISFTFKREDRKAYVEFRNTGSIHVLFSDGMDELIVEKNEPNRTDYAILFPRIRKHLQE